MCTKRYELLPIELRREALRFLNGETERAYWYQSAFGGPTKVLEKASKCVSLRVAFRRCARQIFGLRNFREDPNDLFTEPQPPGRSAETIVLLSSRVLVKQAQTRAVFQSVSDFNLYRTIVDKMAALHRSSRSRE